MRSMPCGSVWGLMCLLRTRACGLGTLAFLFAILLVACAEGIPQQDLDRCEKGRGDLNESYARTQGSACRTVAAKLVEQDHPDEAMRFARRACELEDARGCEMYLSYAMTAQGLSTEEVLTARTVGERACFGNLPFEAGVDLTPSICARVGRLYMDVDPKSATDARRFFARSCMIGEPRSCTTARLLGAKDDELTKPPPAPPPTKVASTPPPPPPPPTSAPPPPPPHPPTVQCHEMRGCVALDVKQRNVTETVGTLTNNCSVRVKCTWCPVLGQKPSPSAGVCGNITLSPGESKSGQSSGLWYPNGADGLSYDCSDANDDPKCLGSLP